MMPPEFQHLTNLVALIIPDMKVTGRILDSLKDMSKLETLSLSNNNFTGSIPDTFSDDHPHLVTIDLHTNSLTGQIPLSFNRLKNLSSLLLSENNLEGPIPSQLGNITGLRTYEIARRLESR